MSTWISFIPLSRVPWSFGERNFDRKQGIAEWIEGFRKIRVFG
jgi:hypothetical protein